MAEPAQRGTIVAAHPNAMFTVRPDDGRLVTASPSGKLRTRSTRLGAGDAIMVERSPFDPLRGRIVGRDPATGHDPGAARRGPPRANRRGSGAGSPRPARP